MVRNVEELRAELKTLRFRHWNILQQRHIELHQVVSSKDVPAARADRVQSGYAERILRIGEQRFAERIRRGVEPAGKILRHKWRTGNVRPLAPRARVAAIVTDRGATRE